MLSAASLNIISWYTDTDEFLEHSPSRGSLYYKGPALQKITPGVFFFLEVASFFVFILFLYAV